MNIQGVEVTAWLKKKNDIKIYKLHPIVLELTDGKWNGGTNLQSTEGEALI
jgi:hypothetical protein